jgi:hypothetical protein
MVWSYGIAVRWWFHFAYLQAAAVGGVESGWRRVPSQELDRRRGAPSMALRLDQDHMQLPLDVL